eukprot:Opistho-1_new@45956
MAATDAHMSYRRESTSDSMEEQRKRFEEKLQIIEQNAMMPENQRKLEEFEVMRTLGTGSFGRVLLSKDAKTGMYCALKVLKKERIVRTKQVEHVMNEKKLLATVNCPFVVNMIAAFKDTRNLYIVLEYVNGGEMFTHLHTYGRFPSPMARIYAAEVAMGLSYLHNLDIIYRDLKPENLLLDHRGHIRITDFGFAKRVFDRTWTLCGTPEYLAPEIILSKGYSHAVDWWALGILIFEMLAGHAPFTDPNPMGIYEKIIAGRIAFPKHFKPEEIDLISHLCTADLTRRYGNMKGGVDDIKNHAFFNGIDWPALYGLKIPAPFIPNVKGPGDANNFDTYPE